MIRTLFIVAGGALVLSIACIAGAAALGGRDLAANDWTWIVSNDGHDDSNLHFRRGRVAPDVTRTLAWAGGKSLTVDLPVDVTYVQGAKASVEVSGPQSAVDRVQLVDGRLTLRDSENEGEERGYIRMGPTGIHIWSETERLKITVTAPDVTSFRVAGSGDLDIERYNQPSLELRIDGSGDVEANGNAASVNLRHNAIGDADLAGLDVGDADIENTGSGDVEIGPKGKAKVSLSGSGDVQLTRRPASLERDVTGSGELIGG